MKRVAEWMAVALLVIYDLYLLKYQLSAVQGNVEAQFIIITPAFLLKHWADVRERRKQHAEIRARLDAQDRAQKAHAAELAAHRQDLADHRADLADHRREMAAMAEKVTEMHEVQRTGRLPKRLYRPEPGEPAPA